MAECGKCSLLVCSNLCICLVLCFVFLLPNASSSPIFSAEEDTNFRKSSRSQNDDFGGSNFIAASPLVANNSCSNTTCRLVFNATDVSKFQRLLDEKALAIFMFVTLTNQTEDSNELPVDGFNSPTDKITYLSVQMREKWAWVRNRRGKFLATLPYDFDILSLTTLTRDVYDLVLNVSSTPADCFVNLSTNCLQDLAAMAILDMAKAKGSVCLKVEKLRSTFKDSGYVCCEPRNGQVVCDTPIENNTWIDFALGLLWACALLFGLLSPLLFKYLPKEFRKSGHNRRAGRLKRAESSSSYDGFENAYRPDRLLLIAKDDGILDVLRTKTESAVVSRLFRCLFVIALSLLPILQALLYWYLKKSEVGITEQLEGVGDAFITLLEPTGKYIVLTIYCFCILLVSIAVAIPKTMSELARRLSGRRDERSFLGFRKPDDLIGHSDKHGFQLIYENMVFHFNCLLTVAFWKFALSVLLHPLRLLCHYSDEEVNGGTLDEQAEDDHARNDKLWHKIFRAVFFLFLFPFWFVITLTAIIAYLMPVTYVAFRVWKMLFKFEIECKCCQFIPTPVKLVALPPLYIMFIIFCICVEVSYFMLVLTLSFNMVFLGSVIGFTITGTIFYIEVYIPYVVITLCCLFYIGRSGTGYLAQFQRLKNVVFEECEKHDSDVKVEVSIKESFGGTQSPIERKSSASSLQRSTKSAVLMLVYYEDYDIPSIPLELFLLASKQLLPFKRIIIAKILKVTSIFLYLMAIFGFVMSLVEFDAAQPTVQALALLFLGAIPLLFQRSPYKATEAEVKWLRFHIQRLIEKYCKAHS